MSLAESTSWSDERWAYLRQYDEWFYWLGLVSVVTFIMSAVLVPFLIRRLPHDYFLEKREVSSRLKAQHPILRGTLVVLRNLLGIILMLAGLIMLVTPGQGILTMLIGLLLLNFPRKRRFELWLIRRRPIYRTVLWIRRRGGRKPLEFPDE